MQPKVRRAVTLVCQQPAHRSSKARLFAYGLEAIAKLSGYSLKTVKRHIQAGAFDPSDLTAVVTYLQTHRQTNATAPP